MIVFIILFMLVAYSSTLQGLSSALDPCLSGNHHEFPFYGFGARQDKCALQMNAPCDYYLEKKWYISSLGNLLNTCPSIGTCGVSFPAWIDGQFPSVADGIVNRTVCIKKGSWCCKERDLMVKIKNCNGFFVFYLPSLKECPSAYCFDSHFPCEATTISPAPSTPWTSSSQILSNATTVKSNDATESSTVRQTVKGDIKIGYSDSSRSTALLTGIGIGAGVVLVAVALGGLFFMFSKYVQARNPSRINIMEKPLNKGSIAKVYVNETLGAPLAYTPKK